MSEPQTAAGRAMYETAHAEGFDYMFGGVDAILAIEDEAARKERERITDPAIIERVLRRTDPFRDWNVADAVWRAKAEEFAAVLAAITDTGKGAAS